MAPYPSRPACIFRSGDVTDEMRSRQMAASREMDGDIAANVGCVLGLYEIAEILPLVDV